jgi:hypothetical protein
MATRESEDLVVLAIALLALVLTTCVWASQTATTLRPPVDLADPANIQAGRQFQRDLDPLLPRQGTPGPAACGGRRFGTVALIPACPHRRPPDRDDVRDPEVLGQQPVLRGHHVTDEETRELHARLRLAV